MRRGGDAAQNRPLRKNRRGRFLLKGRDGRAPLAPAGRESGRDAPAPRNAWRHTPVTRASRGVLRATANRGSRGGGIPTAWVGGAAQNHDTPHPAPRKHPHPEGQRKHFASEYSINLFVLSPASRIYLALRNTPRSPKQFVMWGFQGGAQLPLGRKHPRKWQQGGTAPHPWPLLERAGGGLFRERVLLRRSEVAVPATAAVGAARRSGNDRAEVRVNRKQQLRGSSTNYDRDSRVSRRLNPETEVQITTAAVRFPEN